MRTFGIVVIAVVIVAMIGIMILSTGNAKALYDYGKFKDIASSKPAKMLGSIKYQKIIAHGFDSGLDTRCLWIIGKDGKQYITRPNGDQIEQFVVGNIPPIDYRGFVMYDGSIAYRTPTSGTLNVCQVDGNGVLRLIDQIEIDSGDKDHTIVTPVAYTDEKRILLCLFSTSYGGKFSYRLFDLTTRKLLNSEAVFGHPVLNNTNEVRSNQIPIIGSQVSIIPSWHNRLYILDGNNLIQKKLVEYKKINEPNRVTWLNNEELCFATRDKGMDYIIGLWKVNIKNGKQMQIFDFKDMGAMRCMPLSERDTYVLSQAVDGRKIVYQVDAVKKEKSRVLELDLNDVTETTGDTNLLVISRKTKELRLYSVD
ncbi:MAG: hypothetical protein ACYC0V_15110 [Armatimonadota bacterium]